MNSAVESFTKLLGISLSKSEERLINTSPDSKFIETRNTTGDEIEFLYFSMLAEFAEIRKFEVNDILEIGTGKGTTTRHLARSFPKATVWTIDIPEEDPKYSNLAIRKEDAEISKLTDHPNIVFEPINSFFLPKIIMNGKFPKLYDIVYVDGCHTLPEVAWDIMFGYHSLVDFGFLFCHDYGKQGNHVKETIDIIQKLIPEKFGYLPFSLRDNEYKMVWTRKMP